MSIHFKKHPNHPKTILIREFSGKVSGEDILNSWKAVVKTDTITNSTLGIINDLSRSQLTMNMDGFKMVMDLIKSHEVLRKLKLAVLTNSPDNIVFPMLGEHTESTLRIKPFATEEAAITWILSS